MESLEVKGVLLAAQRGDRQGIQSIIAEGRVGVADEDGNTPLMYAAASGREGVIRILLEKQDEAEKDGVKHIDLQNRYGWTALMQAACYGHSEAVVLLLQKGANPHLLNAWKASSLVLAAQGGHFGVVHALLSHGVKVDPEDVGEELVSCTLTPLMAASQCGHVEVVQELLRGGAKLEVKLKGTKWTALMFAILNNKVGTVELLLQQGADRESGDIQGRNAMELATALGRHTMATLVQAGTIADIADSDFLDAVKKGGVEKVKEMLELKPSLASIEDKDGVMPLMFASSKGHKKVCEVLLEAGVEVNKKDRKYGWTALMHATHNKRYEVVTLLGKSGADVNIRNSTGATAYDIANVISDIKMIKLIATITVEQLESKGKQKSTPATSSTPTPATPPTPTPEAETATAKATSPPSRSNPPQPLPIKKVSRPIDLSELRSRLQNAYRTPSTPKISVSSSGSSAASTPPIGSPHFPSTQSPGPAQRFPSAQSPGPTQRFPSAQSPGPAQRFPSTRMGARQPLLSSSPATPSSELRPSLGVKAPGVSPSKSAGSLPGKERFPSLSPLAPSSPSVAQPPRSRPGNILGAMPPSLGGRGSRGEGLPGNSKQRPMFNSPRIRPDVMKTKSPRATPLATPSWGQSPFPLGPRGGGTGAELPHLEKVAKTRRRANTEPMSPASWKSGRGHNSSSDSITLDLQSVLEGAAMEKYFSLFQEQEVDYKSFLSLCEEDLKEMGIADHQDRAQLLSLISHLNTQQLSKSSSIDTDVFAFH